MSQSDRPTDELFFWTRRWQDDEAESSAAREAGDVHEVHARDPRGILEVTVVDSRIGFVIDGGIGESAALVLTRTQTEELALWLLSKLVRR